MCWWRWATMTLASTTGTLLKASYLPLYFLRIFVYNFFLSFFLLFVVVLLLLSLQCPHSDHLTAVHIYVYFYICFLTIYDGSG